MQDKYHSFQPNCLCRVICPPLPWAQSRSYLPVKGEVPSMTQIWCPMWGTWYVDIQWPGYHPNPALPSAGIGWLPSTQLPKLNKNCALSLRNSVQMYNIYQAPNHPTFGSRVQWLCAHSGWALFMYITCTNCVCISWRGDSAQSTIKAHQSPWWLIHSVPRRMMARGWLSEKDPFPQRKLIPGELRCLNMREVAPDTLRIQADLQFCELTLLTGWVISTNVSKCQGHMTILSARGTNFLFNHQTMSSMLDLTRSGLLALFLATIPLRIGVGAPYLGYIHG